MRKGIPKTYINMVDDMYEGSCTNVKSMWGETEGYRVRAGVHLESALNPYLFTVVMDEIIKDIQG